MGVVPAPSSNSWAIRGGVPHTNHWSKSTQNNTPVVSKEDSLYICLQIDPPSRITPTKHQRHHVLTPPSNQLSIRVICLKRRVNVGNCVRDNPNTGRKPVFAETVAYPGSCVGHSARVLDRADRALEGDRLNVAVGLLLRDGSIPITIAVPFSTPVPIPAPVLARKTCVDAQGGCHCLPEEIGKASRAASGRTWDLGH